MHLRLVRNVRDLNNQAGLLCVVECDELRYCIRKVSTPISTSVSEFGVKDLITLLRVLTKFSASPFDCGCRGAGE